MAHIRARFGRKIHLVNVDFAFLLVKSEVQVALYFWRVALWHPYIFSMCHLWKCWYQRLLKSIVSVKYFESDFLFFVSELSGKRQNEYVLLDDLKWKNVHIQICTYVLLCNNFIFIKEWSRNSLPFQTKWSWVHPWF